MEKINFGHRLSTDTSLPIGLNKFIPTDTTDTNTNVYTQTHDNDILFNQLSDLVNNQFRAWYCRQFYKLGTQRVLQIASVARADGKQPAKLFSKMLKDAV